MEHLPKMNHLRMHTPHKKYEKDISFDVKKGVGITQKNVSMHT